MQLISNYKLILKRTMIIIAACALLIASYSIGISVGLPVITSLQAYNKKMLAFVAGFVIVGIIYLTFRSTVIAVYNRRQESEALMRVPKSFKDIQKLGIRSEIDYCATMQILFAYSKIPNLWFPSPFLKESQNQDTWEEALHLFKLRFGREPYGINNNHDLTWGYLTACEAQVALNKPSIKDVSSEELLSLLSPEVISSLGVRLV